MVKRMRVLWAPWRMAYVKNASKTKSCIFCEALRMSDEEALVVFRGEHTIIMLNKFPYNTAHVMIAPKRHVPRPDLLTDEEALDMHKALSITLRAIDREYTPQGYNIGLNLGRVAGAGIESHMHIHVVPRWSGDSNYMPITASTKVIPEDLLVTFTRLKKAFSEVLSDARSR